MAARFGTSGLRGLVAELDDAVVGAHVRAFMTACDTGGRILIGGDLRPSSPRIMDGVAAAVSGMGAEAVLCGALATPALALAAGAEGAAAIMVTGSHIPADRNGIKFYTRSGEITKADEAAIGGALGTAPRGGGRVTRRGDVAARYRARYRDAFGPVLAGQRIGLYAHSAVGRDDLAAILTDLGAEVSELGRSDRFVPVDTEAVDPATRARLAGWAAAGGLDAIVSTDGDSDRPLLADAAGRVVPGDVMGQIAAEWLGAEIVVTPVSSNSGVAMKGFDSVVRTPIGSPHVIAAMAASGSRVVGYEANGGFLLGFAADGPAGPLTPLLTRDAVLPIVAVLAASDGDVAARVAAEPPVFTASDRLGEVPRARMAALMARLATEPGALLGTAPRALDTTDGLRWSLGGRQVIHVRPSGNAPELRLYVEDRTPERAEAALARGLSRLRTLLEI